MTRFILDTGPAQNFINKRSGIRDRADIARTSSECEAMSLVFACQFLENFGLALSAVNHAT